MLRNCTLYRSSTFVNGLRVALGYLDFRSHFHVQQLTYLELRVLYVLHNGNFVYK